MYPSITLKIQNHTPQIYFNPEERMSRKMTNTDESIYEVVVNLARKLKLINRELIENDPEILSELLDLARQSDELYLEEFPEIETESLEFDLTPTMNALLDQVLEEQAEEYSNIEMDESIRNELRQNQNSDIFASLMETMYTILIAKTLLAATELGVGTVRLDDVHKNPRLQEKMAKELEKLGVDFVVA